MPKKGRQRRVKKPSDPPQSLEVKDKTELTGDSTSENTGDGIGNGTGEGTRDGTGDGTRDDTRDDTGDGTRDDTGVGNGNGTRDSTRDALENASDSEGQEEEIRSIGTYFNSATSGRKFDRVILFCHNSNPIGFYLTSVTNLQMSQEKLDKIFTEVVQLKRDAVHTFSLASDDKEGLLPMNYSFIVLVEEGVSQSRARGVADKMNTSLHEHKWTSTSDILNYFTDLWKMKMYDNMEYYAGMKKYIAFSRGTSKRGKPKLPPTCSEAEEGNIPQSNDCIPTAPPPKGGDQDRPRNGSSNNTKPPTKGFQVDCKGKKPLNQKSGKQPESRAKILKETSQLAFDDHNDDDSDDELQQILAESRFNANLNRELEQRRELLLARQKAEQRGDQADDLPETSGEGKKESTYNLYGEKLNRNRVYGDFPGCKRGANPTATEELTALKYFKSSINEKLNILLTGQYIHQRQIRMQDWGLSNQKWIKEKLREIGGAVADLQVQFKEVKDILQNSHQNTISLEPAIPLEKSNRFPLEDLDDVKEYFGDESNWDEADSHLKAAWAEQAQMSMRNWPRFFLTTMFSDGLIANSTWGHSADHISRNRLPSNFKKWYMRFQARYLKTSQAPWYSWDKASKSISRVFATIRAEKKKASCKALSSSSPPLVNNEKEKSPTETPQPSDED